MQWLGCKKQQNHNASAQIVDGTLILSLPDAISPVVWRMDLSGIKSAAMEIRTDEKEGAADTYTLTMKATGEKPKDIAPFDTQDKAMNALMAASTAMAYSQSAVDASPIASNSNRANMSIAAAPAQNTKSKAGQLLASLIGLAIIGLLLFAITRIGPTNSINYNANSDSYGKSGDAGTNAGGAGVPMSADDFLLSR